jgi:hypothetical protein
MRVYDVEVLDVKIGDETIAKLLVEAQHASVQSSARGCRRAQAARAIPARRESINGKRPRRSKSTTKLQLLDCRRADEVERKH